MQESTRRYRREQELMLSVLHTIGMKTVRQQLHHNPPPRVEKTSFLGVERSRVCVPAFLFSIFPAQCVEQNSYAVQSSIGGRGY